MTITITTRQLFQMLKDAYINRSTVPCMHCGQENSSLTHEINGLAEQAAERIVMTNIRMNDFIQQQS